MNVRNPKMIRLCGWGALVTTLLVVGASGFLAFTFFQSGETLYAGLGAVIAAASGLTGLLLTYLCLTVAGAMTTGTAAASAVEQSAAAVEEPITSAETEAVGAAEKIAIPPAEVEATAAAPEYSDDVIPVFQGMPDESSDAGVADESSDAGDFFVEDLLVVPPPVTVMDDSDAPGSEPAGVVDEFDSRMDLPVMIDTAADPEAPEGSDDVELVRTIESQTDAIVSAITPTAEFDVVVEVPATPKSAASEMPAVPEPVTASAPSLTDAFPDIFKSTPAAATPGAHGPGSPAKAAVVPPPKPIVEAKPATFSPQVVAAEDVDSLPTAAELPDMATILTPTLPSGGMLPSEIPDFFLKMPTGRAATVAKPAPPAAPIAPRQVAAPKPLPAAAPAAVRIVDSTTVGQMDEDLVTLTSIPDDWPS